MIGLTGGCVCVCVCIYLHMVGKVRDYALATVCANVRPTVRAVVVGVLARIDHVRDPEAWPTDEQTEQTGRDVRFGRGFIVQPGDHVLGTGGTHHRGRIGPYLRSRYHLNISRRCSLCRWDYVRVGIVRWRRWWMRIVWCVGRGMRIATTGRCYRHLARVGR